MRVLKPASSTDSALGPIRGATCWSQPKCSPLVVGSFCSLKLQHLTESTKSSRVWVQIKKLYLKTNIRVKCIFVAIIGYSKTTLPML